MYSHMYNVVMERGLECSCFNIADRKMQINYYSLKFNICFQLTRNIPCSKCSQLKIKLQKARAGCFI